MGVRLVIVATAALLAFSTVTLSAPGALELKENLGRVPDFGLDTLTAGSEVGALGIHTFGPVVLANANDFGGEPGVDVAPDGIIYVNAPSGLGNFGSWVYKSTNGGASFTDCGLASGPGGGDSVVAINPQGTIAMSDLWLGSLTFYTSTDDCASWTPNPVSTPVPVGDRQWLDYGHSSCEFFQSWDQIPLGLRVMRTTNCGLTWSDHAAGGVIDLIGNLVVDHSGKTTNVYQFYTVGGSIRIAIGKVSGSSMTWTQKVVAPAVTSWSTADSFPAGAIDAAGNVHVAWQAMKKTGTGQSAVFDSQIHYRYSTDGGNTWSATKVVSNGGSSVFPWIDAGASGKVNVVYYHADVTGNPNNINGPWFVDMAQATTLGGAFSISRATPLSIHNDVICTSGTGCGGDDRDLLDFFEVAHNAAGQAVIAFAKDTTAAGTGNGDPRNAFVRQSGGPTIL